MTTLQDSADGESRRNARLLKEEEYERAQRKALALLEQGFHLSGVISATRDELHER